MDVEGKARGARSLSMDWPWVVATAALLVSELSR